MLSSIRIHVSDHSQAYIFSSTDFLIKTNESNFQSVSLISPSNQQKKSENILDAYDNCQ